MHEKEEKFYLKAPASASRFALRDLSKPIDVKARKVLKPLKSMNCDDFNASNSVIKNPEKITLKFSG